MDIKNDELQKDLEEQYAMLENEIQEDKKKKRYLVVFIFFLVMFLIMFGTTFSYFKIYSTQQEIDNTLIKSLSIKEKSDLFTFDESIKSYVVTMPSGTKRIDFEYEICKNCEISISGNDNLKEGVNEIVIKIKNNELQKEEEYIIYVVVESEENPENNQLRDLRLKDLNVANHIFTNNFVPNITSYITNEIYNNEDKIKINFKLIDPVNNFKIVLNGSEISRKTELVGDYNTLELNVKTELVLGANKLEIKVYDEEGNSKTYYIFLDVKEYIVDQKVINIEVEPLNGDGTYSISNVIPGWESDGSQAIRITNKSNYNAFISLKWIEVTNDFTYKDDLKYEIINNNKTINSGTLPSEDTIIAKNINISANSSNIFYVKYKYLYSDNDQNIDQGKIFKARIIASIQD